MRRNASVKKQYLAIIIIVTAALSATAILVAALLPLEDWTMRESPDSREPISSPAEPIPKSIHEQQPPS